MPTTPITTTMLSESDSCVTSAHTGIICLTSADDACVDCLPLLQSIEEQLKEILGNSVLSFDSELPYSCILTPSILLLCMQPSLMLPVRDQCSLEVMMHMHTVSAPAPAQLLNV